MEHCLYPKCPRFSPASPAIAERNGVGWGLSVRIVILTSQSRNARGGSFDCAIDRRWVGEFETSTERRMGMSFPWPLGALKDLDHPPLRDACCISVRFRFRHRGGEPEVHHAAHPRPGGALQTVERAPVHVGGRQLRLQWRLLPADLPRLQQPGAL